ncbi:hypothetical protein HN682_02145 [Candidatus Peregrinibacteria bacterium]|nr:hypothetical protein [Candidatus Peregrinibacteria bacterium]
MDDDFNPEESEENVYSEEGREGYVESGEISAEEEAFMKGYEDAEDDKDDKDDKEGEENQ